MLFVFSLGWTLHHISPINAKTTIRLWHELHVEKKIPHDFQDMVYPLGNSLYLGVVKNDEIRAIAQCRRKNLNSISVSRIAHAPEQLDAVIALINLLHECRALPDWQIIQRQHRWYYEELYLLSEETDKTIFGSNNTSI